MIHHALISGASSGIGLATAELLAKQQVNLTLVARRQTRLESLAIRLREENNIDVHIFPIDLTDGTAFKSLAEWDGLSSVDLLVNNAGLAKGVDKLQDGKLEDWDVMLDTNVRALLHLTRLVLPFMLKNQRGHIVNVGSVAGRWVYPGGGVYCATKHAVRAISEGLRMDLFGTPIRVTNIEPGMVETEFSEVRLESAEKAKAIYKGMTPLTAADVAEAIWWSISRPAHVNVQELVLFPTAQAAIQQVARG